MIGQIEVLTMRQVPEAYALVKRTFDQFEGKDFPSEGTVAFYEYMDDVAKRYAQGEEDIMLWGYYVHAQLVGVCAMIADHIGMLFVDEAFHRQGIAKVLIEEAKNHCRRQGYQPLTINAFPYAISIYHHMGFQDQSTMQVKRGMSYVPMYMYVL